MIAGQQRYFDAISLHTPSHAPDLRLRRSMSAWLTIFLSQPITIDDRSITMPPVLFCSDWRASPARASVTHHASIPSRHDAIDFTAITARFLPREWREVAMPL